jgi:uncharacterized surface anchored protein
MKKQIISIILALVLALSVIPTALATYAEGDTLEDALSKLNVAWRGEPLDWLTINGTVRTQTYTYFNFLNDRTGQIEEHPVYCIDPTKGGVKQTGVQPEGAETATYVRGEKVGDAAYSMILAAGYPHTSLTALGLETTEQGYYATKMALWLYILGGNASDLGVNPAYTGNAAAQRIYEATVTIFDNGIGWSFLGITEPALTLTPDKPVPYTDPAGQYYQQKITISSNKWIGDVPSTLGDFELSWEHPEFVPAGTKILAPDGADITSSMRVQPANTATATWSAEITLLYPKDVIDENGITSTPELKAKAVLAGNNIFIAYYDENPDAYQRYLVEADPKQELEAGILSQFSPDGGGDETKLRVLKLETGTLTPLSGAVFDIYDPDGTRVFSLPADSNGEIIIPLARMGNYTVTERVPPKFHLFPEHTSQSVTVRYGETAEVTFTNDPYGSLRVLKRDAANGRPLSGAVIQIKHIASGVTFSGATDASGGIVFNELPVGGYEIRELAAPDGYTLDAAVHTVSVSPLTEGVSSYTLTNSAKPGLHIRKIDLERAFPIAGVVFEVWRDGSLYGEYMTDSNGEIYLPELAPATYLARETSTVEPYELNAAPQWIELTPGGGIRELLFTNAEKTGIYLLKVDAETLAPLVNAQFRIERVGGGFSQELFTDVNGEIEITHLASGVYQVFELTPPESYLPDASIRTIEILPAKPDARFVFTNAKRPSLEIVKYDSRNGIYIPGAVFRTAKIEDGTHYLDRVTDTDGRIRIENLEPGVFSVRETSAPGAYVLNTREYHVELFPGRTSRLVVENVRKPSLIVRKYDLQTAEPLANAEFSIVKKDNSYTYEGVTNDEGYIRLDGLEEGWYTVTELAPPPGYLPASPLSKDVYLKAGETAEVKFDDLPCPTLTINKIDKDTLEPLSGVNFNVRYAPNVSFDGGVIDLGNFTTNDAGQIVLNDGLKSGWFRVTELAPPPGYVFGGPASRDIFLGGGDNKTLTFENIRKPSLIIRKYDLQTTETLPNAEFSVRKKDGPVIFEGVTDGDGKIVLSDLEPGYLTITELAPPPGYLLASPVSRDVYLEAGKTLEVKFDDLKCPTLKIFKLDSITRDPIKNVKFNVKFSPDVNFTGGVVDLGNYTTDGNGRILLDNDLKAGWLRVTELEPAHGYELKEPVTQDIYLKGGENKTLTFENIPLSALIIRKTDSETGQPVSGASFTVKYLAGNSGSSGTTIFEGVTSINGTIILTALEAGTYVVEETAAAPSYELSNPSVQTAYISGEDQDVVTLTFSNAKMGGLVIKKLDSVTKQPVKDVTFKVTDSSGGVIGPDNGEYITDAEGLINIAEPLPIGSTVIVQEIRCPDNYIMDTTEQSVKIKENTLHTLTFYNTPKSGLLITKYDSVSRKTLPGAVFRVTDSEGKVIGSSNGRHTTDARGQILIPVIPGDAPVTLIVTEEAAPRGYALNTTPQIIRIDSGKGLYTLDFYNEPLGGLQILKKGEDGKPVPNTEFSVAKMNGERIGTYKTDVNGAIYLMLDEDAPIWLTITETKAAEGYLLDTTPRSVEGSPGKTAVLELVNKKAASILLRKTDSVTGKGIYGVTFLLYDKDKNPIRQYVSDQSGYVYIGADEQLPDGRYYLRELAPAEGYEPDDELKTIYIEAGRTSGIEWKNKPIQAQIQILKYAYDYNGVTGSPAGTPLQGAVFEITRAKSGAVVGYITSDARGVAASEPLPLGRYYVREVTPARSYVLNPERFEAELEYAGQIVKLSLFNKSAILGTSIKKTGNYEVLAGDSMWYGVTVENTSNVPLSDFYWSDRLPTDASRALTLITGTYNQRLYYRVLYRSQLGGWKTLASNLLTTNNYSFSLNANALGLAQGDAVMEVKLEFGTVQPGLPKTGY